VVEEGWPRAVESIALEGVNVQVEIYVSHSMNVMNNSKKLEEGILAVNLVRALWKVYALLL
jgi:hypothetical protein